MWGRPPASEVRHILVLVGVPRVASIRVQMMDVGWSSEKS